MVIDLGTATTIFASCLNSSGHQVQVATHSLSVALELRNLGARVRVLGGNFEVDEVGCIPPTTRARFNPFHGAPYKFIMTAETFSAARGAATSKERIQRLNQRYINYASETIILMDHSKFVDDMRAVTTRAGIGRDSWLRRGAEQPVTIVTDMESGNEPDELRKLRGNQNVTIERGEGKYSDIAIIKSILRR